MCPAKIQLIRGESRLIGRLLLQEDGEALPVAALKRAQVKLMQSDVVVATITMGEGDAPALREGTTANELLFELTAVQSAALAKGLLTLFWVMVLEDDDFESSSDEYTDIWREDLFVMV